MQLQPTMRTPVPDVFTTRGELDALVDLGAAVRDLAPQLLRGRLTADQCRHLSRLVEGLADTDLSPAAPSRMAGDCLFRMLGPDGSIRSICWQSADGTRVLRVAMIETAEAELARANDNVLLQVERIAAAVIARDLRETGVQLANLRAMLRALRRRQLGGRPVGGMGVW